MLEDCFIWHLAFPSGWFLRYGKVVVVGYQLFTNHWCE